MILGLIGLTTLVTSADVRATESDRSDVMRSSLEMVAMSDGTRLETHIHQPMTPGRYPVVLCRTPYSPEKRSWLGEQLTPEGFVVVLQSVRGQGASEGTFIPFVNERTDGVDTADWITEQPWSDGRILLWGVSYHGYTAFELAMSGHKAVQGMFSISAYSDLSRFLARDGAFQLQAHLAWYYTFANGGEPMPAEAWDGIFRTTPTYDFFRGAEPVWGLAAQPYDLANVKIPVLQVTGWYDYIYPNVLEAHAELAGQSRGHEQRLIIGPWGHNGVLNSWTEVNGTEFGPNATAGIEWATTRAAQWYRHVLDGESNALTESHPVRYFVMNANRWLESPTWPPADAVSQQWFIGDEGTLTRDAPSMDGQSSFTYDPNDPVMTVGGANSHLFPENLGPLDQSELDARDDVLTFTSAPVEQDVILAGPLSAVLYAATTATDVDLTARLSIVQADGFVRKVEEGLARASHLFGRAEDGSAVTPGEVYRYDVSCGATALAVRKGERLRVSISAGTFPRFDRNPQNGIDPLHATAFASATHTILHSSEYPSHMLISMLED
jgi:predicted acyl esterase